MARISVKLHGKEVSELLLEESREYTIGRGKNCDLELDAVRRLSRLHLKIYKQDENWVCELVSKYGELIYDGESIEALMLDEGVVFSVPPYDLHFSYQDQVEVDEQLDAVENANEENLSIESSAEGSNAPFEEQALVPTENALAVEPEPEPAGNLDDTNPGIRSLEAVLRVQQLDETEEPEVISLKGESWVAGREDGCNISLAFSNVSRRHFEIQKHDGRYLIRDLGSANGTLVNGTPLKPDETYPLNSGDTISIKAINIYFEIHDKQFNSKLQKIENLPALHSPAPEFVGNGGFGAAKVIRRTADPAAMGQGSKKAWIFRGAIALLLVGLVYGLLSEEPAKKVVEQIDQGSNSQSFENLSKEKQQLVKDSFELAKRYYKRQDYPSCIAELGDLHKILPQYKNSAKVRGWCDEGLESQRLEIERERKRREAFLATEKVNEVILLCKEKMTTATTIVELNQCLRPAMDISPENAGYEDLRSEIKRREIEKQDKLKSAAAHRRRLQKNAKSYQKAKNLYSKRRWKKAINAYKSYLKTNLPDPKGYKGTAKRELASARKKLDKIVSVSLKSCKKFYADKKFKDSIMECDKAIKQDPANEPAKSQRRQSLSELRKDMKLLYEDSILEESMGNVSAAKVKWQEIMKDDIPEDEYYRKAKSKLKKYGVGI